MKKKVVVDVDAGSDDAVALLLLLTSESSSDYQVLGVTCTQGNTIVDNVCRNVLLILETVNRLDVPVYRGAELPLVPLDEFYKSTKDFHGKDGLGDANFPPPKGKIQSETAVEALNRIAVENKGISLICLGPLTNIALAIRTYSSFSKHVNEVFIMGGNTQGMGNATPTAEFNFFNDPEAVHIVLSSLKCPITILPWEPCRKADFLLEERLKIGKTNPSPVFRFLNQVEAKIYSNQQIWNPCDAFLAGVFLEKEMIETSRNCHMTIELHGKNTRGQCVIDHLQRNQSNVRVVDKLNFQVFKKLISEMASYVVK